MKTFVLAAVAGALFAAGLTIGGMTIPAKVIGFFDVRGAWDPQVAFVMLAAVSVYAVLLRSIRRRPSPLAADRFHWPPPRAIDARLVGGAAIFGVGWGLSGFCPGPALVSLAGGGTSAIVFVVAMLGGIAVARALDLAPRG